MERRIEITGCSLVDLIHAAYEITCCTKQNHLHRAVPQPLTDNEAYQYIHFGIAFPVAIGDLNDQQVNLLVLNEGYGRLLIEEDWTGHSQLQMDNLLLRIGIRYNFAEHRHQIGCGCWTCQTERMEMNALLELRKRVTA
jgi:hypothetical protein